MKRHIAAEPVELGDGDRAFAFAGVLERRRELRPAVERVDAFARFDLDALVDNREALGLSESCDGFTLRLDAEA